MGTSRAPANWSELVFPSRGRKLTRPISPCWYFSSSEFMYHSTLIDVTYKLQTVNDRWMWLKSYKPFKNCERYVPRELLENWKMLARDVNAIPLCSTLEYALVQLRQQTLCFISAVRHFFKSTARGHAGLFLKFQNWEICCNISSKTKQKTSCANKNVESPSNLWAGIYCV